MTDSAFGVHYAIKPQVSTLKNKVKNLLLVGNSLMFYNCGVNGMLNGLSKATGIKLVVTMVGIGGASLYWHDVKSYLRPNGLRSYQIANDGSNKLTFIDYPNGKIFDAVILCDSTQGPIHPELRKIFAEYATKHADTVRQSGADPLLMMTWGYLDKPGMTRELADSIISVGNDTGCMVIPCGIAVEKARALRPELRLIRTDNRHPTVAGTYLEACVFFSALTHTSTVGCGFNGRFDDLVLSDEDARFLQQVAWDTVTDFYGWEK